MFITLINLIILCELNFVLGKLQLNRMHRDDFHDLKPILIPKFIRNWNNLKKMLKHIKIHCTDHIKTNYIQMLVEIKKYQWNCIFVHPKLLVSIYTTLTQHTDVIFGPNLSPTINFRFFHSLFTPLGAQNRVLNSSSIQTYRQIYRCKQQHLDAPSWSYIHPTAKTVQIWLEMTLIWVQTYGTFMYEGPSPLPGGIILCTTIQLLGKDQYI